MLAEIRRKARSEGMVIHPMKTRAWYLKGYGFDVDVLIDVGVDAGTPWFYATCPSAKLILVDPLEESEARASESVGERDVVFHAVALGETKGKAVLQVPETADGPSCAMSSLLDRQDNLAKNFTALQQRTVPVETLDEIAQAYTGRVGLKIDTEGYERNVLAGGRETLKRCDFVILEMSVTERFAGVAPPSELVGLLARAGLELRDVLAVADGPGKRARPRHMDVLFARWATT